MIDVAKALILGFFFGWMLHKGGLTHYARIVGVYRLRDMTVLRFMVSALLVAAVLLQAAVDLGITHTLPIPPTFLVANLVGGVVFGVGMATAGYCTGTVVAQAGEGHLDAWIGGLPGLIVGAIVFGLLQPHIMPALTRAGALGRATFASLTGASPWLVLIVFCRSRRARAVPGRAMSPAPMMTTPASSVGTAKPGNALEVERLSVRFGATTILRDLSFDVPRASSLAVIGPNGAGKTVLFQALIGALPHAGAIRWAPGTRIGYVPQKLDIERDLPVTGDDFLRAKATVPARRTTT